MENTLISIPQKEYAELKEKAYQYDQIKKGIAEFYEVENEFPEKDLTDIGEWIAGFFNYI